MRAPGYSTVQFLGCSLWVGLASFFTTKISLYPSSLIRLLVLTTGALDQPMPLFQTRAKQNPLQDDDEEGFSYSGDVGPLGDLSGAAAGGIPKSIFTSLL